MKIFIVLVYNAEGNCGVHSTHTTRTKAQERAYHLQREFHSNRLHRLTTHVIAKTLLGAKNDNKKKVSGHSK